MDNNINVLDELYKGCDMGIQAIDMILNKMDNHDFSELLNEFKDKYIEHSTDIKELYKKYTDSDIHEVNTAEKIMTWYGIMKDTIFDESDSKIAELLINGTNMGIIEGRKILNNKKMDKDVYYICCKFVKFQEKYLDKLKDYL